MALPPRLLLLSLIGIVPALLLSSCGEEATGSRTTLETVQNTSYVVEDPVTTTTTTTLPAVTPEGQISEQEQIYVVVANDSLSKIASLHGITLEALVNYNEWTDGIAHVILPGAEIRIPPFARVAGTATGSTGSTGGTGGTPTQTTAAPAPATGCEHTIVAGDNPTRVANKYDVTFEELQAANASNPVWTTFLIGSKLNIPASGSC